MHDTLDKSRADERREKMYRWISHGDPSTNYNKALKQRHQRSGTWFLESKAYDDWKTQPNSFLWLHGIPGCGKTVLSSTIIQDLKQNSTSAQALLYFFFDFNDVHKQSLESMLRTLIAQLYQQRRDPQQHVEKLWSSCEEGTQQPTLNSLDTVLRDMLGYVKRVTVVLDALDESQTRAELLAWLNDFIKTKPTTVQLIATARGEEDIESALKLCTGAGERIAIQRSVVNEDIRSYVRDRVQHSDDLKRWRTRTDVQEEIEAELMRKADGM